MKTSRGGSIEWFSQLTLLNGVPVMASHLTLRERERVAAGVGAPDLSLGQPLVERTAFFPPGQQSTFLVSRHGERQTKFATIAMMPRSVVPNRAMSSRRTVSTSADGA